MFNCCSHGTLLHFGLQSSRLNICYYHQDLHPRRLHPDSRPRLRRSPRRPSYSSQLGFHCCRDGPVWVRRSSAIHFQGWLIRQVSCYTLLSGFRLPWPPSCCLYQPTPFVGSDERCIGHFNSNVRFIPHRQSCLPRMAHLALAFNAKLQLSESRFLPI